MCLHCYQSDGSRHIHQQTDESQILFQTWCHLYTRKTTVDPEMYPAAHQTEQVPTTILQHWLQPFVAYCTEMNQSILSFSTFAISMKFAFQKFMRRSIKGLLDVQYECIYLTSCNQNFSPIIYYCDQLSFTATILPSCLSDRSLCSSRRAIIVVHTMFSSILQRTHVKGTER